MDKIFYVTIQRGSRVKVLAGPFATYADAAAQVEPARRHAEHTLFGAHFDGFGVTGATPHPSGALPSCPFNEPLGITPVAVPR